MNVMETIKTIYKNQDIFEFVFALMEISCVSVELFSKAFARSDDVIQLSISLKIPAVSDKFLTKFHSFLNKYNFRIYLVIF